MSFQGAASLGIEMQCSKIVMAPPPMFQFSGCEGKVSVQQREVVTPGNRSTFCPVPSFKFHRKLLMPTEDVRSLSSTATSSPLASPQPINKNTKAGPAQRLERQLAFGVPVEMETAAPWEWRESCVDSPAKVDLCSESKNAAVASLARRTAKINALLRNSYI